jgi:hypothetical protein
MLLAAARKICRVGTRHQIAIEPAAAGYSPFRDFVHCSFADAGRRWVWLRSPTAGIRKPSHNRPFGVSDEADETIAGTVGPVLSVDDALHLSYWAGS